ncbi:hypothetical protein AAZX31_06G036900 [Glycine max]|uniref:LNS2/PITP domain-containing protein n=1 Tax=Glycine max TaxID=3847 RepID=K7KSY5_SOYBN|nr:phosphatidate phosphatase PAH2 [Glycine max]KAH1124069.1 hypothetical protein GYH30_014010 [Glycine max]KAH1124070.1 hypothetical protein GYH30_014010 [Glycine max]KAH1124071.1 hypothetical protein GYH30_014010 [Glycine max]KRH51976.1 hypothetical protein GLYMA_06G039200v4 [Glycine max]KRH51977.1 hypothetical protein GLYMA_06G039200v4 [Glycine max]|eukprot:XP_006581241.1 phosphatidate phosphatase PAH2 isoform X1 [Glycine max]
MQAVGRIISQGVVRFSGPFHPFGGAVDIVVVEQKDGTFKSSPWYVRFGKFQGVLKAREKVVDICVNGVQADFQMHLDHTGEAFFLREIDAQGQEEEDAILMFPSSSADDEADDHSRSHSLRSKSLNYDAAAAAEVVGRTTSSRRSRILGLVFGRRSLKREDGGAVGDGDGTENRVGSLERAQIAANLLDIKWSTNLSAEQGQDALANPSGDGEVVVENGELNEESCFDGECDLNGKEVMYDTAGSDVQVACVEMEVEACVEKGLNGEELSIDAPGKNSNETSSETSKLGVDCSSEQAHGEVNVHVHDDEVLHGSATVLLAEDTEAEEVIENAALEFYSRVQQTASSDSDDVRYNEVVVEEQPTSPKPQTVKMSLGHYSNEKKVEPNCVIKNVSSTLSSPSKASRRSSSPSSEDENFLFSDLDKSVINDRFERSFSPEHVDKEDHVSYGNDTEKLTAISNPIVIPRTIAAVEEVVQLSGSLPNISSGSDIMVEYDVHYPLSQSLDSNSTSLPWAFPGKDDLECLKSDEDKRNQLPHEEQGAKDYNDSGEFKGDPSTHNPSPGGSWRIWPFSLRRAGSSKSMLPPSPSNANNATFVNSPENTTSTDMNKNELKPNLMKKKVKEMTPTSEQLASLNLKDGMNTVTFTFSTAVLGKQQVDCRIYLWKWNTRIVISDVDGTITRSDVLGQFMPLVGIDWSQTGVAHLFSAIKENGYQLLFLSARSISQAYITRQFLVNLKQDGKVLPDGPVVISPDGLFPSLYREVIRRVPHEFKIACLEDIKALFPSDSSPFYAGFGNRDTDEISYLKVGIPLGKIFIINPRGEVVVNRRVDTKSYTSLHALVNGMFPPTSSSEQEDFNSWNFWKLPPPAMDI